MNAVAQACRVIKKRVNNGTWVPGAHLPTLAGLAELCGVSRTTMWRALAVLQRESVVHVEASKAIVAGPALFDERIPGDSGFAWEQLRSRLGKDVLSGRFSGRILPRINKLALEYRVSINTIKRSLAGLVNDRILDRAGIRYAIARPGVRRNTPTVVFLSEGNNEWGIFFSHPRTQTLVESVERECRRLGFASWYDYFNPRDARRILRLSAELRGLAGITGYIISVWHPGNATMWQRWIEFLHFVSTPGLPVVIIDQDGTIDFPQELCKKKNVRILRIAGMRAGETVADLLVRLRLRKTAFVTPDIGSVWANARYQGMCRYFKQYAATDYSLEVCTGKPVPDLVDLVPALLGLSDKESCSLYDAWLSPEEIAELPQQLTRARQAIRAHSLVPGPALQIARPLARVLARVKKDHATTDPYKRILERVLQLANMDAQQIQYHTLFAKTLDSRKCDAWVCSSDNTAVAALRFLRKKGVRVPADVSVVGFDNWEEAYRTNLTTFDFDMRGIIEQALLMIANEKYLDRSPKMREVDGYVVERRTTNRAKGAFDASAK